MKRTRPLTSFTRLFEIPVRKPTQNAAFSFEPRLLLKDRVLPRQLAN